MLEEKRVINLPRKLRHQMLRHVMSVLPEEACGFVAGKGRDAFAVLPVTNSLHSPVRFMMDPLEQLNAMQWIEQNGLDVMAIYHSHPSGPAAPSATDLAEHSFPEALGMLWSRSGSRWRLRCFEMLTGNFKELSILTGVKNVVTGE